METIKNIIIGFGKGGKTLAKFLAQKGEEVLVIEKSNKMYGGVAYDPVAKNIWVTGSQDDSSALMSFSLKKLEKYSYNKKKHKKL